jgi:hypothetical protein
MNVRPHGLIDAAVVHRFKEMLGIGAHGAGEKS